MTDQHHPITPPPELVEDWIEIAKPLPQRPPNPNELAALAARWGADQELEACCEWTRDSDGYGAALALRADRRALESLPVTDILDDAYESDLTDEEHEGLILISEHAIAKPLSPAAQAVQDAAMQYEINPECYSREIAATLRAAADQVVPVPINAQTSEEHWALLGVKNRLLAIADELEAQ